MKVLGFAPADAHPQHPAESLVSGSTGQFSSVRSLYSGPGTALATLVIRASIGSHPLWVCSWWHALGARSSPSRVFAADSLATAGVASHAAVTNLVPQSSGRRAFSLLALLEMKAAKHGVA